MTRTLRSAQVRREELQEHARALGIDEAYIALLVETFYQRIRKHPLIGPVFNDAIGEDWGPHLEKMKKFWASVALHTGTYSGQPVPKHQALTTARDWHFGIWLALFRQTLDDTAPSPAVVDYFTERAERIAESLKLAMFGGDGLPPLDPSRQTC